MFNDLLGGPFWFVLVHIPNPWTELQKEAKDRETKRLDERRLVQRSPRDGIDSNQTTAAWIPTSIPRFLQDHWLSDRIL